MGTGTPNALQRISSMKIYTAPFTLVFAFIRYVFSALLQLLSLAVADLRLTALGGVAIAAAWVFLDSPPEHLEELRDSIMEHGSFGVYWITLGVLSSVGLGSGLHTFLLFLGPHIILVASTASICKSTNFTAKMSSYLSSSPQYEEDAWKCVEHGDVSPSIWAVISKVQLACFLWGLGTAIGELPPYFVSRQARLTGQKLEELAEVDTAEQNKHPSLLDRAKIFVHESVHHYGFIAIFIAASIPNPLFDLAGLTCGHFLIPFWTFFGATVLGKAVVKVHIQAMFYAVVFNISTLEFLEKFLPDSLDAYLDFFKAKLLSSQFAMCFDQSGSELTQDGVDACKSCCSTFFQQLHGDETVLECAAGCSEPVHGESIVKTMWGHFVTLLILYFVISIIEALAKAQLIHEETQTDSLKQKKSRKTTSAQRRPRKSEPQEEEEDEEEEDDEHTRNGGRSRSRSRAPAAARPRSKSKSRRRSTSRGRSRSPSQTRRGADPAPGDL